MKNPTVVKALFVAGFLLSALPFMSSAGALILGSMLSLFLGNPFPEVTAGYSKKLLKLSVIGLGFGVNFLEVIETGKSSIGLTFISISLTILIGIGLGKLFSVNRKTSSLIAFGTAICGGSAIAAMAAHAAPMNSTANERATTISASSQAAPRVSPVAPPIF